MAKKKTISIDDFSNRARIAVTMSGADALTFQELVTGIDFREMVAWVIHRIDYFPAIATIELMTATTDLIQMALVTRDNLTTLSQAQSEVIDYFSMYRTDAGVAANANLIKRPFSVDFSQLPGGGKLIPAESLFLAMDSQGLASAGSGEVILTFSYVTIDAKNYNDLIRSYRVIS